MSVQLTLDRAWMYMATEFVGARFDGEQYVTSQGHTQLCQVYASLRKKQENGFFDITDEVAAKMEAAIGLEMIKRDKKYGEPLWPTNTYAGLRQRVNFCVEQALWAKAQERAKNGEVDYNAR